MSRGSHLAQTSAHVAGLNWRQFDGTATENRNSNPYANLTHTAWLTTMTAGAHLQCVPTAKHGT